VAPETNRWILIAHSAGFESALALMRQDYPIDAVVLLDALYAGEHLFERWVLERSERRLVLLFAGHGTTAQKSRQLGNWLRASLGSEAVSDEATENLVETVRRHRVAILRTRVRHGDIPSQHLEEIVEGLRAPVDRGLTETSKP